MSYNPLSYIKITDNSNYEREYERRLNGHGTFVTKLMIFPFNKREACRDTSKSYPLFSVHNNEIALLQEKIQYNAAVINEFRKNLPSVAGNAFVHSVIIDEIQSTNEIEGVRSTKKEIGKAFLNIEEDRFVSRFTGLVKMYVQLFHDNYFEPVTSVSEIRELYNDLLGSDIDKKDEPDGELFRMNDVSVNNNNEIIHRGSHGEETIKKELEEFIAFINSDDVPFFIRVLIGHYYFEYIHPFYDGNGRLGRYLACRYLAGFLDPLTACSFSHAIITQKRKYYDAFTITSKPKNKGEATMFLYAMLKLILDGQKELLLSLKEGDEFLRKASKIIEALNDIDPDQKKILYYLSQSTYFEGVLTNIELAKLLERSKSTIATKTKALEESGYIFVARRRPKTYYLTGTFTSQISDYQDPE